jgi:hypothetical protein
MNLFDKPEGLTQWKRGDRRAIAKVAGITEAYLSEILHRKKCASIKVAKALEEAMREKGYAFMASDAIYSRTTRNPLMLSRRKRK